MNKKEIKNLIEKKINEIGIEALTIKILDSNLDYKYNPFLINITRNLVFHILGDNVYKITLNDKSTKNDLLPVINELKTIGGF